MLCITAVSYIDCVQHQNDLFSNVHNDRLIYQRLVLLFFKLVCSVFFAVAMEDFLCVKDVYPCVNSLFVWRSANMS